MDILKALNNQPDPQGVDHGCEVVNPCHNLAKKKMIDVRSCLHIFDEIKSSEICITFKPQLHDNWDDESLKGFVEDVIRKALKRAPQMLNYC